MDRVELRERLRPGPLRDLAAAGLGQRHKVVRMRPVRGGGFAALREAASGIVADEPEDLVARDATVIRRSEAEQARRDQRADAVREADVRNGETVLDRPIEVRAELGQSERAAEHAEPAVQALDLGREKVELQSIVARRLRRRRSAGDASAAASGPGAASSARASRRSSSWYGASRRSIAPASSIASGSPSTRLTILARAAGVRRRWRDARTGGGRALDQEADGRRGQGVDRLDVVVRQLERVDDDHGLVRPCQRRGRRDEEADTGDRGEAVRSGPGRRRSRPRRRRGRSATPPRPAWLRAHRRGAPPRRRRDQRPTRSPIAPGVR